MYTIEPIILRSRPWPAYLVILVSIGVILFSIRKEPSMIYVGIGLVIFSIALWILISKTRLIIDNSGIAYKTAFTTINIPWNTIQKTYIKYHQHGKSGSFDWYFESVTGQTQKFSINLLSRKSIRILAEAITMNCKNAVIEKRIYDMADGKFPWYIW